MSIRGILAPALALLIALSTPGRREVRRRDTQGEEVLLLDCRKWVDELALGPDFGHHHRRKLGHHHERRRLLRGLLVPPRQRSLRGLHVDPQGSFYQTP